jgi:prepilin-type N-terminal cleavage/methylation domain-containing protein/prepilin-type processing-associated H-X9-DG protein
MNLKPPTCRAGAFTLVELLCVIAIIGILAALILPTLNQSKDRVKRIECENNLRQLGVAFHAFMHDHSDQFPMAVSQDLGGSLEFARGAYAVGGEFYFSYRHFQTLANELSTPAVLICPADTRLPATNFAALQNSNVSYFVGAKAAYENPNSILAGDRNLTANSIPNPSLLHSAADNRLWWTGELHRFKGNFLFADGRVEEWSNSTLGATAGDTLAGVDLFLPSVAPAANHPDSGPGGNGTFPGAGAGRETPPTVPSANHPPENNSPAIPGASGQSQTRRPIVASTGPRNPPVTAATNSTSTNRFSTNSPATVTTAPDETGSKMSTFDQRMARDLRWLIFGTYLLVLVLFLLRLAYLAWRRSQREKEQRPDGF